MIKEYAIYYGCIIVSALFAWLAQRFAADKDGEFKLKKVFWIISIAILALTIGCRTVGVGVDDLRYEAIFHSTSANGPIEQFKLETMEPGYLVLNYIVGLFTNNFQIFLFIVSLISIILFYKAIEYERKNVNLFLVVFLFGTLMYLYFFGIIRLFLAASIIAYALRFVIEKRTKEFIIFVFLATTIHYSAFFMLFLLYFSTEKKEKPRNMRNILLELIIALPIAILLVSKVIFPMMGERYALYLTINPLHLTVDQFDKLPIFLLGWGIYRKNKEEKSNIKIYLTMCAATTIVSVYSSILEVGRIQWLLMFSICILLPWMVRTISKNKKYQFINAILVMAIMIYGIVYSYRIVFIQSTNKCMRNYSNVLFNKNE